MSCESYIRLARTAKSGDTFWLISSVERNVLSVPTVVVDSTKLERRSGSLLMILTAPPMVLRPAMPPLGSLVDLHLLDGKYVGN